MGGRVYLVRLHSSNDTTITLWSTSGPVLTHTLHAADGRSMRAQPALLDAYVARLQPLLRIAAPHCDASPSLHLVGIHGTDTIVASVDLTAASSYADVRRLLLDLPKVPQPYAFLYRGSILGRALEPSRRPWCISPPRRIDIQLQTRQETRHHVFVPTAIDKHYNWLFPHEISDMDRDIEKRDEARRQRAAASPPRTHCTLTLHVDIPSAVLTVDVRATVSTTLQDVLDALRCEHGIDAASTHDVCVLSTPHTILPITTRLSAANIGHGSALSLHHRRVDVALVCAGTLTVLCPPDTLRCSHSAMTQARFSHWQLSPGDSLSLDGDTYTVTAVNMAAGTVTVHPAVVTDDRWDLLGTKHLRQVLVDPRFPWELDGRMEQYLASHVASTATTTQFSVELCTRVLLETVASQLHLVQAAVQTLPLDICVGILYDDLCTTFPVTHGVTNVKFSLFLKSYRLHTVLLLTSAASVHAYFSLHLRPHQSSLLLPDWKTCLVAMAHSTYKHVPAAHPPPKTPNDAIAFFIYAWVLVQGPVAVQRQLLSRATEMALRRLGRRLCAVVRLQATHRGYRAFTQFRLLRWRTIRLQALWRCYAQRRRYLVQLAAHHARLRAALEMRSALVLVCFVRRSLRRKAVQAQVQRDRQVRAEKAAFWHDRRLRRRRHERRWTGAITVSTHRHLSTRLLVSLHRDARQPTVATLSAYNPITSAVYVLHISTSLLTEHLCLPASASMALTLSALTPRLQLVPPSTLRLSVKPVTYRRGECVHFGVWCFEPASVGAPPASPPLYRMIVEAYRTTGLVTLRIYNPRDSFVWQTVQPYRSPTDVMTYLHRLHVIATAEGGYTLATTDDVTAAAKGLVALACQCHYRRRRALQRAIQQACDQWVRVQVRSTYEYVHRVSGWWRTSSPKLLTIFLSSSTPTHSMVEYQHIRNTTQWFGGGPYYIYPRRARRVRLSLPDAAVVVQIWFRHQMFNHNFRQCVRALAHTQRFDNQKPTLPIAVHDLSTLHVALATHLGQLEARTHAALLYEYAMRLCFSQERSLADTALVHCCASAFWLATETAPHWRRWAHLQLQRYGRHLHRPSVDSIEYLFYQTAYLHRPTHPLVLESFAVFLDRVSHRPGRALDVYTQALARSPSPMLLLNYAAFRMRYPALTPVSTVWTAKPLGADGLVEPTYPTLTVTRRLEVAAAVLQRWLRKRTQRYLFFPTLTEAVWALQTNTFAEARYIDDRHSHRRMLTVALHIHFVLHDADRAKALYHTLLTTTPNEPLVRGALLLDAFAQAYLPQAMTLQLQQLRRQRIDWSPLEMTSLRFAVVTRPHACRTWLYYGLYRQLFCDDVDVAERLLCRASRLASTPTESAQTHAVYLRFQRQRMLGALWSGQGPSRGLYWSQHSRAIARIDVWYRMEHHVERHPGQSRLRRLFFWVHAPTGQRVWERLLASAPHRATMSPDVAAAMDTIVACEAQRRAVETLQTWCRVWTQRRHYLGYRSLDDYLPQPASESLRRALGLHFELGRWRDAQALYTAAVYADPTDALAVGGLLLVLGAQRQCEKALRWRRHWQRLATRADAALLLLLHSQAALTAHPCIWWGRLNYALCLQYLTPRLDVAERVYSTSLLNFPAAKSTLSEMHQRFLHARRWRGPLQGTSPSYMLGATKTLLVSHDAADSLAPWTRCHVDRITFWYNTKTERYRWHLPEAVRRRHWQLAARRLQAWYRRSWARPLFVWTSSPARLSGAKSLWDTFASIEQLLQSYGTETTARDPVQLRCGGLAAALELPRCDAARVMLTTAASLDPTTATWQLLGDVVAFARVASPTNGLALFVSGVVHQYISDLPVLAVRYYWRALAVAPALAPLVTEHEGHLASTSAYKIVSLRANAHMSATVFATGPRSIERRRVLGAAFSFYWWDRVARRVFLAPKRLLYCAPIAACTLDELATRLQRWVKQHAIGTHTMATRLYHNLAFLQPPAADVNNDDDDEMLQLVAHGWSQSPSEWLSRLAAAQLRSSSTTELQLCLALGSILDTRTLFLPRAVRIFQSLQAAGTMRLRELKLWRALAWHLVGNPRHVDALVAAGVLCYHVAKDVREAYNFFSKALDIELTTVPTVSPCYEWLYQLLARDGYRLRYAGPSIAMQAQARVVLSTTSTKRLEIHMADARTLGFYVHIEQVFWRLPAALQTQFNAERWDVSAPRHFAAAALVARWWRRRMCIYYHVMRRFAPCLRTAVGLARDYVREADAMAPLERALYVLSFLGDTQEAQKSLEVLMRETPNEPLVLYGLALSLLQCDTESLEVPQQVRDLLVRAAELDPRREVLQAAWRTYFAPALRVHPDTALPCALLLSEFVKGPDHVVAATYRWLCRQRHVPWSVHHYVRHLVESRDGGWHPRGGPPRHRLKYSLRLSTVLHCPSWSLYLDPTALHQCLQLYWYDATSNLTYWTPPASSHRSHVPASLAVQHAMARRLQRLYRRYVRPIVTVSLYYLVQALKYHATVEAKYKAEPTRAAAIINYTLHVHTFQRNGRTTKALYRDALKVSAHPVLSCAYAIHLLATCQAPRLHTLAEANQRIADAKAATNDARFFSLALHAFFHYAVLYDPNDPTAWLHLALVLDHIYDDVDRAETCFLQAQTLAPSDPCITENYTAFRAALPRRDGPTRRLQQRAKCVLALSAEWHYMKLSSEDVAASSALSRFFWYNRLRARAYWRLPTALGPLLRATASRRSRVEAWSTVMDTYATRLQRSMRRWLFLQRGLLMHPKDTTARATLAALDASPLHRALRAHFIELDVVSARGLYEPLMRTRQPPGVALYAYSLLLLSQRASSDQGRALMARATASSTPPSMLAWLGHLLRWSVVLWPSRSTALVQSSLYHELVLGDLGAARFLLARALRLDANDAYVLDRLAAVDAARLRVGSLPLQTAHAHSTVVGLCGHWQERAWALSPHQHVRYWVHVVTGQTTTTMP
ncbi:hypothetical protein SDRG_03171 [Saprolegnia diclina VS20]|uniref:WW domain-containing protein n=1 Tax=Saprolegnia diclina (strain VS20) TaxID=1156394 RepID=T0R094_SAPDV|nr:hypothetical protein SDRG_03171 [Saprolegnia diclina VS20]EQC39745.1 hypothetical protein SDRG_03171 [Saprolegnia diclina VS20]|eukprot:XP_008607017.1 hypothetical protein SDRG_03171 [Saprolegnia diclina VS20]